MELTVSSIILATIITWLLISVVIGPVNAKSCLTKMQDDGYYINDGIDTFLASVVFIITSPLNIINPALMGDVMDFVLYNVTIKE